MKEIIVSGKTLPEAYHKALVRLEQDGETVPCPDYNTVQKELSMTMCVAEPLAEPMISRLFIGGFRELEQYRQEMLDGILDFEVDRGNWEYTYHRRYAPQLPFVVEDLRRNPYSRRAVISVRNEDDLGSSDPACLQHMQFFIRDDGPNGERRLHCKILFRSNDACKAAFMNAFALVMLQKRIAGELGVAVGTYTHRASSFHCYQRDYGLLRGYAARIADPDEELTYDYEGEWEELMEMAKPEIAASVKVLRER